MGTALAVEACGPAEDCGSALDVISDPTVLIEVCHAGTGFETVEPGFKAAGAAGGNLNIDN